MSRIVLDTNTLVSALGWSGPPQRLLDACMKGRLSLFVSPAILDELVAVLARPKLALLAGHPDLPLVLSWLYHPDRLVIPAREYKVVRQDPDDDKVIACAVAAGAEAIISGDSHLRRLGEFRGIMILRPREACERWGV